jgi:aspartate/methionine/tyrosine aminotransferase
VKVRQIVTWFPASEMMSLVDGAPRFDLGESVGPDCRLAELFDISDEAQFAGMPLAYGTAAGEPRLRTAIAEAHGVNAEDVVTTMGGIHALFLLALILCSADDEAVTTAPLFPLARNALDIGGATVRTLPLRFDRGYRLDVAELRAQLSPRTKLVSLATPQNPSGVSIGRETLRDVLTAMSESCPDAYLLVDETYREAAYGDDAVAASAACLSPKVVVVASLSKCHGAPGLRLGWAIARDRTLREQFVRGKFSTVISCSPLCEALALKVFERRDSIIAERRTRLAAGLTATATWVRENRELVDWVRPNAGALCCVRLQPSVFDDSSVARFYDALTPMGARVANGRWFGDEERVFRLGFGLMPTHELRGALDVLTMVLKQVAVTTA